MLQYKHNLLETLFDSFNISNLNKQDFDAIYNTADDKVKEKFEEKIIKKICIDFTPNIEENVYFTNNVFSADYC